jgi:hypothetical protein
MQTYIDWMKSAYYVTVTGHPAISVPCGFTPEGLPVGGRCSERGDSTPAPAGSSPGEPTISPNRNLRDAFSGPWRFCRDKPG